MHLIARQFQYLEKHKHFPLLLTRILKSNWTTQTHCSSVVNTFTWSEPYDNMWDSLDDDLVDKYGPLDESFKAVHSYVFNHYTVENYPELHV